MNSLLSSLFITTVVLSTGISFNDNEFRRILVDKYNFFREIHDVEPLVESSRLERSAQLWAEYLGTAPGKNCIHHSLYGGENIYFHYNSAPVSEEALALKAVTAFYEEIKYYDFRNPGMVWPAAHFTQMTWKSVERIGVGVYHTKIAPCLSSFLAVIDRDERRNERLSIMFHNVISRGDNHGGCNIRSTERWPATAFFVVVHHSPHGNIMTKEHFARNVLKPRDPPSDLDFQWEGNTTAIPSGNESQTTPGPATLSPLAELRTALYFPL